MPKVWIVKEKFSDDVITQLLHNRKLTTQTQIESFFHPQLKDFEKELEISGLEKAQERIEKAIKNEEQIYIYGDYDVDGISATAILYHTLSSLKAKVLPYIPHRDKEGYGLSKEGLKTIKDQGAKLVITVDNGIVALEQAEFAYEIGLDLIITDHHIALEKLPKAEAIVHNTTFCGAGVVWCLARKLLGQSRAEELLDLVAIATVCDLMCLTGVNRVLVKEGLKQLNQNKRVGLLALIIESGIQLGSVNTYHIGHILGPRLNAIGRLEHAIDGLRLLCTKDIEKARKLAKYISETNDQKKLLTTTALTEAKELVINQSLVAAGKILVLHSEKWISGIIGLMAGRIAEEYKLPAIIISQGESISKGSARSSNGLNIVETLRKCSDVLLDIGGHPGAAGFTIETARIEEFKTKLGELVSLDEVVEGEDLEIESIVKVKQLTKKLAKELEEFEPTGLGNPKPILASLNMQISDIRTVGSGQHLKFKVVDPEQSRRIEGIDAIAFSFGNLASIITPGQYVNLAYLLEIDNFRGNDNLQLNVLDIQIV